MEAKKALWSANWRKRYVDGVISSIQWPEDCGANGVHPDLSQKAQEPRAPVSEGSREQEFTLPLPFCS